MQQVLCNLTTKAFWFINIGYCMLDIKSLSSLILEDVRYIFVPVTLE